MENIIEIPNEDKKWVKYLQNKLENENLTEREKAYISRIIRVYNMPDLSKQEWNPVEMIISKIVNSEYYRDFTKLKIPEIVWEYETFDLFNFEMDHVARRPSDSYFINKNSENTKESMLLRPHTSVMWYHYLVKWWWFEKLDKDWEIKILSWWKTYRVDELDKTHHECFHQIDGLRIVEKSKEIINQDTLKDVLVNTIKSIFWMEVPHKFHEDFFPYTQESLEVEIEYNWRKIEVLWSWVVHPNVLESLWIDSEKYNWWAFGFGIERLAMLLKDIPDIRIFWSQDPRVLEQWWNFNPYNEVSNLPPVYKDISFIVDKKLFEKDIKESEKSWEIELLNEADSFDIAWIVRNIAWDLIEEVRVVDIYENDKLFWEDKKSVTINITFRSLERSLTHDEINKLYFDIRDAITNELWYQLR